MFTTPCFIRKNTPELRKKLDGLGYGNEMIRGLKVKGSCLSLSDDAYWNYWDAYMVVTDGSFGIDCGENEALFLALAALRDDSDKHQWFTDGTAWEKTDGETPSRYMQMNGHKATAEELI